MLKGKLICLLLLISVFVLSGCVVRTYPLTKDRVDQGLTEGNKGYLKGQASLSQEKERKTTRTTQVVEIELSSPIKFDKKPKTALPRPEPPEEVTSDEVLSGNRGFITESVVPEINEPAGVRVEEYKVQKGDTLQKISQKFYGTTKKWNKIYDANKDTLKGADKIYSGQVINIPLESLKETKENLK